MSKYDVVAEFNKVTADLANATGVERERLLERRWTLRMAGKHLGLSL